MEHFSKYQVALTDDCVAHGGRQEYPDGWVGEEVVPPQLLDDVAQDAISKAVQAAGDLVKAQRARRGIKDARLVLERAEERLDNAIAPLIAEYFNSMPYRISNLRYLRFGGQFIGRNRDGHSDRKTDRQNGMWIPTCQLHVVVEPKAEPEPEPAPAAA